MAIFTIKTESNLRLRQWTVVVKLSWNRSVEAHFRKAKNEGVVSFTWPNKFLPECLGERQVLIVRIVDLSYCSIEFYE